MPLDLSVVRRFDLSGKAKYFFIPFKGTSKTKNKQKTSKQTNKTKPRKQNNVNKINKEEKKENDHV